MMIFISVLCFSIAVLLCVVALLLCRNPRPSQWSSEMFIGSLMVPAVIGLGVIGVGALARAGLGTGGLTIGWLELLLTACTVVGTCIVLKRLRIRKTLATYTAKKAGRAQVIDMNQERPGAPKPPAKPRLKRAA
jgi:hypothetical protein